MHDVGTPEYEASQARARAAYIAPMERGRIYPETKRIPTEQGRLGKPNTPHYQQAEIEPIDYIRGLGVEVFEGFCTGNVIKYVTRAPYKGTRVEDLKKARQYLDWLIASVEE